MDIYEIGQSASKSMTCNLIGVQYVVNTERFERKKKLRTSVMWLCINVEDNCFH